ncbi:uncharacterized protein LOC129715831 isoform X2 [Leucoraja erinacea]|uniref:uncharacterized protein LOC129715831 isoform X2 n=1 Tax=Leucoraja erinaceus TaxID=7782 RepID=UPI002455D96F|nr:uncharacterized protein LOC129715831 isoform X2 [Leucoraja erinacea]
MVPIRWKVLPIGEAQPLLSRQIKTEEGLEVEVKVEEEWEEAETHQEIEAKVKEEQSEVEAQVQVQEIEVKVEEARVKEEEEDLEEVYRVRSIAPPRTKLTTGISSRANSSEDETDPPEGPPEEPSGYGTVDKQQHAKRKPACTTAADCDVPVEQWEMFADITQQAKTTAETISDLSQPRTPHERIVYAYSALLREEMLQIPESQWHSYCLEGLVLARAHRLLLPVKSFHQSLLNLLTFYFHAFYELLTTNSLVLQSPMRPMPFMPHPQMGMMAPQHAPQVHCETFQ